MSCKENDPLSHIVEVLIQAKKRIYEKRHGEENEIRMENQDRQLQLINDLLFISLEID